MFRSKTYLAMLTLCTLMNAGAIHAQEGNAKLRLSDSIPSEIPRESRKLIIHLPADYGITRNSYPVLYLLDGSAGAQATVFSGSPVFSNGELGKQGPDIRWRTRYGMPAVVTTNLADSVAGPGCLSA